jgi:hypothetical protein
VLWWVGNALVARGENNFIRQWNVDIPPSKYDIDQVQRKVTIKEGSLEDIFKFEAFDLDTSYPYDPGVINQIVIDADGAGVVKLMVAGDPQCARHFGARDVYTIDLWNTLSAELVLLRVSGNLGEWAGVVVDDISGDLSVGGDLLGSISADSGSGDITITGDAAYGIVFSGGTSGDILIGGTHIGGIGADSAGDITISGAGPHSGPITLRHSYSRCLTINGDMTGNIDVGGALTGSIVIGGDVVDSGDNHIHIHQMDGGHFECQDMELIGDEWNWFVLGKDAARTLLQTGTIQINGTLRGALYSRTQCALDITINEIDAEPLADEWVAGATIQVGGLDPDDPSRLGAIGRHGVRLHGRRERARQIACPGNERISNRNQVFTRCRGVRRGLSLNNKGYRSSRHAPSPGRRRTNTSEKGGHDDANVDVCDGRPGAVGCARRGGGVLDRVRGQRFSGERRVAPDLPGRKRLVPRWCRAVARERRANA